MDTIVLKVVFFGNCKLIIICKAYIVRNPPTISPFVLTFYWLLMTIVYTVGKKVKILFNPLSLSLSIVTAVLIALLK